MRWQPGGGRWGRAGTAGALALLAALLAMPPGCMRSRTAASVVETSAMAAFPKESVAVLVLDIQSLQALEAVSRWMQEMGAAAEQEGAFREVKERFGIEMLKKLTRLGLALVPRADGQLGYALLAEGDFDPVKLKEVLGGQEILTFLEMEGKPDFSATVLAGGSVALGPRQVLEAVRANAGKPRQGIAGNSTLIGALGRLPHDAQVWGAVDCRSLSALVRQASERTGMPAPAAAPLEALKALAFQSTIGTSVEFAILGESDDEKSAKTQADAVRGVVALGRMGANQEKAKEWLAFLDGITIVQKGSEIRVQGTIPEATLAALARQAREGATGAAPEDAPAGAPDAGDPAPGAVTR